MANDAAIFGQPGKSKRKSKPVDRTTEVPLQSTPVVPVMPRAIRPDYPPLWSREPARGILEAVARLMARRGG